MPCEKWFFSPISQHVCRSSDLLAFSPCVRAGGAGCLSLVHGMSSLHMCSKGTVVSCMRTSWTQVASEPALLGIDTASSCALHLKKNRLLDSLSHTVEFPPSCSFILLNPLLPCETLSQNTEILFYRGLVQTLCSPCHLAVSCQRHSAKVKNSPC